MSDSLLLDEDAPSPLLPAAAVTLQWSDFVDQFKHTTAKDVGVKGAIIVFAWFSMSAMMFGVNFMLDSFKDSRAASYTTLLSTALAYLAETAFFCFTMFIVTHCVKGFSLGKGAFRDVWQWRHLGQLAVLGTVDALGGVTNTYAAPNTPIALQFTILATSVVWTFIFAKWLVPDRDRPCTPLVALAVFLTIVGAAVTIVPQWDSMEQLRGFWSSVGWIIVYGLATIFPLTLNVLYARYLVEHVDQNGRSVIVSAAPSNIHDGEQPAAAARSSWPFFLSKLSIAFFGDAVVQVAVILIMLPLDFVPWFGASSSADQTGRWIDQCFSEIFEARYNARTGWYFLLYVYGFFASHLMGASMSYYSPQLTAFIYSLNVPMNLILLVIFPSWNVFSQHAPVWASATSIVVTAVGAILYASWEHAQRLRDSLLTSRKTRVPAV